MNRDVKPLHAFLIIIYFLLLLMWYFWANGEAVKITGPDSLYKNQENHFFIRVGTRLLYFDNDGFFKEDIDLGQLGVTESIGNILFTHSNEIILRLGGDGRSLVQKIRAFLRLTNKDSLVSRDYSSGLYRCNLETYKCNRFTSQAIDYNSVFHLEKDGYDQGVFLADAGRHRIVKYNVKGEEVQVFDQGLKFPNQMKYLDNKLYIVNTNYKQIKVLDVKEDGFDVFKDIDVVPDAALQQGEAFPASIALVNDQWWIVNMKNNMANGGVYRFDRKWNYLGRLDLPVTADPVDILMVNENEVMIADPTNFKLYMFQASGARLNDYQSPRIDKVLIQRITDRQYYTDLSYAPVAVFIISLGIGLIMGLRAEVNAKPERQSGAEKIEIKLQKTKKIKWLGLNDALLRKMYYLLAVIVSMLVLNVFLLNSIFDDPAKAEELVKGFIFMSIILVAVPLSLIIYLRYVTKAKIGIQGDYIHLKDHSGQVTMGPVSDASYDNRAIILNNVAVITGNKINPFYVKNEMKQYFYPLLEKANRVNAIKMTIMLYKLRHPVMYLESFIILLCLAIIFMTN